MTKPEPKHRKAKHRAPGRAVLPVDPAKALRSGVVLTSVAAATTGVVVGGGVLASGASGETADGRLAAASAAEAADSAGSTDSTESPESPESGAAARDAEVEALLADRDADATVSRSDTRSATDPTKAVSLSVEAGPAVTQQENGSDLAPRELGQLLLAEAGFGQDQWSCLDSLWTKESGWRVDADNPSSSAYGIPQALPGSKMSSEGADWATNAVTQIRWGLGYIEDRYGTPCSAWAHSQANNWY
ncbi:lytic transglycosylase domain-containing protein [Nocardioides zeae]|uniref:aggregation-promoting factor C-terminal-like domain-containing protein n=1 Tax=Nocardioides zeae TaxID=1457234 RepID=UPI0027D8724B|nr:lytic transglycosylase domain-containing protein [Nocardioides zeae]